MAQFVMPSLGADMEEGTILEWLVKPGDSVRKGDVVAVIDTAKAAVDVECFTSGTIGRILVPEGEKVPVGTPLAVITEPSTAAVPPPPKPPAPAPAKPVRAKKPAPAKQPLASPPVRTFAVQHGIDLATVSGTGRGGAITRDDVARVLGAKPKPAPTDRRITPYARKLAAELDVDLAALAADPVRARDVRAAAVRPRQRAEHAVPSPREDRDDDAMRRAIASLMARSKREIPHYYLSTTIDLHTATAWLRERNLQVPVTERIVPAALLLKAGALAAKQVPQVNGHWIDDTFQPGSGIHLGIAVSLRGGGLIAPAIQDADTLGIPDLMTRLRELVSRTRSGRLKSSELTTATITVTNLGDLGVESVQGVIYPPQVALIGFGAVVSRPWAVDGMLTVRPVVTATLAADHRASDGATGARLLNTIDQLLQRPEEL